MAELETEDMGALQPQAASVPTEQTDSPADHVWRCFHCDDVFTTRWAARDHFGHSIDDTPACQIKAGEIGLVEALRAAERDASDAWFALQNESTTTAKAFRAMQGRHQSQLKAMEQLGYERGLADAKAYPETLGLALAATQAGTQSQSDGVNQ